MMEKYEEYVPGPIDEEDQVLDLGTIVIMGAITVVSVSLMVLGAVKLGELVRLWLA